MSVLKAAHDLERCRLLAVDGDIGRIGDFLFDDATWTVRYLVARTGDGFEDENVLISPVAAGEVREADRSICIELTLKQIAGSPPLSKGQTVSRDYEVAYHDYYNWPPYWRDDPKFDAAQPDTAAPLHPDAKASVRTRKPQLRSAKKLEGYRIASRDGGVGRVADLIVDIQYWKLRYLVVDAHCLRPNRRILISPWWIDHIGWARCSVCIEMGRAEIETAPGFDSTRKISRNYEARLFGHYGRAGYWR